MCNPHGDRPVFADCWYNCTVEDISGEDKKQRLRKVSVLCSSSIVLAFALFGYYLFILISYFDGTNFGNWILSSLDVFHSVQSGTFNLMLAVW